MPRKQADPESRPPVAYSYIRFSSPKQAEGDSLRRQTEAAAEWCLRNKVSLDTNTSLHDLGKSAFTGEHRKNPDRHALAGFLRLVEQGKIPRGSHLIIENLDRLSREHIRPALTLLLNLIEAGVRVVQLKPVEQVFGEDVEPMQLMMAIMELSRGHSESAIKSERGGEVWAEKRKAAREKRPQPPRRKDGRITKWLTSQLPAWVKEEDGKLVLIPERAAVVQRIFELAAAGYGYGTITRRLIREKVPPFGEARAPRPGRKRSAFCGQWVRAYVAKILMSRRAVGEFQPCGPDRKPDGDPIPNYFPAAISEQEWLAARAGAAQRRFSRGRLGKNINVFARLLRNARDGGAYYSTRKPKHVLLSINAVEKDSSAWSFPYDTFERGVLSMLREIDPHEILNGDSGPDETLVLSGEVARVESSIALIDAEMNEHGESPTLFRRLREKEALLRDLAKKLAEARQKAAHPLSETWGEAKGLMAALDAAPDPEDARLRLRSALRRMIDSVMLLVVVRGLDRLAAVQIWFAGGKKHRDYLILHRPPHANRWHRREGHWWARSLATVATADGLDLRNPDHAKRLEAALLAAELDPPKKGCDEG